MERKNFFYYDLDTLILEEIVAWLEELKENSTNEKR